MIRNRRNVPCHMGSTKLLIKRIRTDWAGSSFPAYRIIVRASSVCANAQLIMAFHVRLQNQEILENISMNRADPDRTAQIHMSIALRIALSVTWCIIALSVTWGVIALSMTWCIIALCDMVCIRTVYNMVCIRTVFDNMCNRAVWHGI